VEGGFVGGRCFGRARSMTLPIRWWSVVYHKEASDGPSFQIISWMSRYANLQTVAMVGPHLASCRRLCTSAAPAAPATYHVLPAGKP
jgi:hypothetical protein